MESKSAMAIRVTPANLLCTHCGSNIKIPAIFKDTQHNSGCGSIHFLNLLEGYRKFVQNQTTDLRNEIQTLKKPREELLIHLQTELRKNMERRITHFAADLSQEKKKRREIIKVFRKKLEAFEQAKESLQKLYINLENKMFYEEDSRKKLESDLLIKINDLEKSKIFPVERCSDLGEQIRSEELKMEKLSDSGLKKTDELTENDKYELIQSYTVFEEQLQSVQQHCINVEENLSNEEARRKKAEIDHLLKINHLEKCLESVLERSNSLEHKLRVEQKMRVDLCNSALRKINILKLAKISHTKSFTDLKEKLANEVVRRKDAESDLLIKINDLEKNKKSLTEYCSNLEEQIRSEKLNTEKLNASTLKKITEFEKDRCELIECCNNFEAQLQLVQQYCVNFEEKLSNEEVKRKEAVSDLLIQMKKSLTEHYSNLEEQVGGEKLEREESIASAMKKIADLEKNKCELIEHCNNFEAQLQSIQQYCVSFEEKLSNEEVSRKEAESDLLIKMKKSLTEHCSNLEEKVKGKKLEREESIASALKTIADLEKDKRELTERCNNFEAQLQLVQQHYNDFEEKLFSKKEQIRNEKLEREEPIASALKKIAGLEMHQNESTRSQQRNCKIVLVWVTIIFTILVMYCVGNEIVTEIFKMWISQLTL